MINWIKEKLGINALEAENIALKIQLEYHRDFVQKKVNDLKEYTYVDADVGFRGNNTIILTGVYQRKAYIRFYDMGDGEFRRLVDMLHNMRDHALIRHVDKPPNFAGTFDL